jgi:hypothetical protein
MALAGFSQAQDFRPATPAELALTGTTPAAILDWVRVDDDTTSTSSEYYRIKVFTDEGKKYGDVEVRYFPSYPAKQRVTEISARTIQPDGRIVPFNGTVYDKVVVKSGRQMMKAMTFSIADVQPGSIIEYRYQRRWSENLLLDTLWLVQRDIPLMHAKLSLKPYKKTSEFSSYFKYVGLPEGKIPKASGAGVYVLELENMPALVEEEYAPPLAELQARVDFYYTESKVRPEMFWSVQAATWSKSIESFIGKDDAYRAALPATKSSDPMETARDLYGQAQALRNLSFVEESSESEAKNGADVLKRGAGYANEINRAFVGMARAAGLEAYAVRVAPRDDNFFSDKLPDADQMSGEISALVVNGATTYLDPGTPGAPFGVVSWEKSNVPGFRVSKNAPPQWMKVAELKPEHATTRRKADLRVTGEALEGTIVATFEGQEAIVHRLRSISSDDAAVKKAFEDEARGWFADGAEVKMDSVKGMVAHDEPVVVTYTAKLPLSTAGSRVVVPLSVFEAASKNPFAPVTRTHPIYFHYPFQEQDDVTVTLLETHTPVALPPPAELNAGALKYTSAVAQNGNTITFHRTMSVNTMLVEPKYYNAIRTFFSNVVATDQKPLILTSTAQ